MGCKWYKMDKHRPEKIENGRSHWNHGPECEGLDD